MVVNKVGSGMYYIIVSLILGLMILTISLFWIFGEYFGGDEIDWQVCRQSILLRASIPDTSDKIGKNFKDLLNLKCKTQVIEVDGKSYDDINRIFADTVAICWYTYGEGELDFFVTEYWHRKTYAMVCARLKFSSRVLELFEQNNLEGNPSFERFYKTERVGNSGQTYEEYLPYYDFDKGDGSFISWMSYMNPSDENYFVIYTQYKHLGGAKIGGVWFWKEEIENSERSIIQLIPEKYLDDEIEGVEVLTIPA